MVSFIFKGGGNDSFASYFFQYVLCSQISFFSLFHCFIGLGLPHTDENPYNSNLFNCLGKDFWGRGSLSSDFCPSAFNANRCLITS